MKNNLIIETECLNNKNELSDQLLNYDNYKTLVNYKTIYKNRIDEYGQINPFIFCDSKIMISIILLCTIFPGILLLDIYANKVMIYNNSTPVTIENITIKTELYLNKIQNCGYYNGIRVYCCINYNDGCSNYNEIHDMRRYNDIFYILKPKYNIEPIYINISIFIVTIILFVIFKNIHKNIKNIRTETKTLVNDIEHGKSFEKCKELYSFSDSIEWFIGHIMPFIISTATLIIIILLIYFNRNSKIISCEIKINQQNLLDDDNANYRITYIYDNFKVSRYINTKTNIKLYDSIKYCYKKNLQEVDISNPKINNYVHYMIYCILMFVHLCYIMVHLNSININIKMNNIKNYII